MAAPEAIREALDRVSASREFSTSPRLAKFLRYIVEETLEGRSAEIKEYSIGLQVLGRGADFDPKSDAIVRVEAGRLRARLALYYASAGRGDSIRFLVPTGGYIPQISEEQLAPAAPASALSHETPQTAGTISLRRAVPWRWLTVAAAAVSGVVAFQLLSRQPAPLSIAVLPVINRTGDSSRDTYAAGIAEDVAAKLAQEQGLGVERVSPGGETAVRSRCRLSLTLQAGPESRLRLIASLDDTGRKTQIWGQSYDAGDWSPNQFRDLFSELLARTLHRMFGGLSLDAIEARSRHNQEALDFYVRGYQEWLTQRRPGIEKSIELYRQAVAREPGFSDAWAALGASALQLANSELSRADRWSAEARAALTKALATDDRNAEAHARLGNMYMTDWDFTSAVRELRRAAELRPGNSAPARWLSMASSLRGLDARRELEFGLMANPGSDAMPAELGRLEFEAGRLDRAGALARQSLRADKNYGPSFFLLALVAERRGDLRSAQSYLESCAPLRGWEFDCAASLARLRGEHFGIAPPDANSFSRHYSRALIHLARKDRAAAAAELEAGIDAREPRIEEFVLDPQFRSLLSIPSLREKVSVMRVVLGN